MPKSSAERTRACLLKKRARARTAGLCITCCRHETEDGRSTCLACSRAATERKAKRRMAEREDVSVRSIIRQHEHAGDITFGHYLYEVAVEHFQNALRLARNEGDSLRITEKLAQAFARSADPERAVPLFEQVLTNYLDRPNGEAKAISVIAQITNQFSAITDSTILPLQERAITIAKNSGNLQLFRLANLHMASSLMALSSFDAMKPFLAAIEPMRSSDPKSMRIDYFVIKGASVAVEGRVQEAYDYLHRAVRLVSRLSDNPQKVLTFWNYAVMAFNLGDIEISRRWYEHALLVSREINYDWITAWITVQYANLLRQMGEYKNAHDHLLKAIELKTHSQATIIALGSLGIQIAIKTGDEELLEKCANVPAFEQYSKQFGALPVSFADYYAHIGDRKKAETILHKALTDFTVMSTSPYRKINWSFARRIARYGSLEDLRQVEEAAGGNARTWGHSKTESSTKLLFLAYCAQRHARHDEAATLAFQARSGFTKYKWHSFADDANAIIQGGKGSMLAREGQPLGDIFRMLTKREQLVAELALKHFTNREISDRLGIREHTVEKHMSSVMRRLDIRSRYQLAYVMEQ